MFIKYKSNGIYYDDTVEFGTDAIAISSLL